MIKGKTTGSVVGTAGIKQANKFGFSGTFVITAILLASFVSESFFPVCAEQRQDPDNRNGNRLSTEVVVDFNNTTQGPLWPPASLVDENGDYIVVGSVISEVAPGVIAPLPEQSVLVSKDTVPPLDASGKEDFSNPFGAPYSLIRSLDLSPGSPDLDIPLYANSFGPPQGDFGGGPRIPMLGESRYNLNGASVKDLHCPELFPSDSQRFTYTRTRFALHRVPIPGFQGDQVAYDVDTGEAFVPNLKNGAQCLPQGCAGEDDIHHRSNTPISLGRWLEARVRARIRTLDDNPIAGGPTAAEFTISAENLLPESIYIVVAIRSAVFEGRPILKAPDPPALNSVLVTDFRGRGRLSFRASNPFPDPATDDAGLRIVGLALAYKSDFTVSGGCPIRLGPGVDIHAAATTISNQAATAKLLELRTVADPAL